MRQLEKGKDKGWHELTRAEEVAACCLGYNAASWERGESPCEKAWAQLSREQYYAAQVRAAPQMHRCALMRAFVLLHVGAHRRLVMTKEPGMASCSTMPRLCGLLLPAWNLS